jgi:hypothetical protein
MRMDTCTAENLQRSSIHTAAWSTVTWGRERKRESQAGKEPSLS